MKQVYLSFFALVFALFVSATAFAHDIEVKNADGVTIYYNYINNGTELEVSFCGSGYDSYSDEYQGNVVIPEEVTPYMNSPLKVTSIGNNAFQRCSGLTSIEIPNSVTSIGNNAFQSCSGLTSITIPNSVTSIGEGAFLGCYRLTSVTIPNSVTSIGGGAFDYCSGLTKVTLNSNAIASKSYSSSSTLRSIFGSLVKEYVLGDDVTSIGNYAFYNCIGLTSVTIPNSVTSIGSYAFRGCSGLTSIEIPNSVTSIGKMAFYNCSGLTSVTIGNGVTSIGESAFGGADIPTIVSLIENPSAIKGKTDYSYLTFSENTFNNATLYVPVGTIEKYKATKGWKDFANIVEGTPTGITSVSSDKETTNAPIYDLNGRRLTEPQKGINIIGGKKVLIH